MSVVAAWCKADGLGLKDLWLRAEGLSFKGARLKVLRLRAQLLAV